MKIKVNSVAYHLGELIAKQKGGSFGLECYRAHYKAYNTADVLTGDYRRIDRKLEEFLLTSGFSKNQIKASNAKLKALSHLIWDLATGSVYDRSYGQINALCGLDIKNESENDNSQ